MPQHQQPCFSVMPLLGDLPGHFKRRENFLFDMRNIFLPYITLPEVSQNWSRSVVIFSVGARERTRRV
jgi:hypothetical protein